MSEFTEMVVNLIRGGADPNELQNEFNLAVRVSDCEWDLWGDGRWRKVMPSPTTKDILKAILHEVQSGESSEDEAVEQIIKVVLRWECLEF